jgi:hypothetical protein
MVYTYLTPVYNPNCTIYTPRCFDSHGSHEAVARRLSPASRRARANPGHGFLPDLVILGVEAFFGG